MTSHRHARAYWNLALLCLVVVLAVACVPTAGNSGPTAAPVTAAAPAAASTVPAAGAAAPANAATPTVANAAAAPVVGPASPKATGVPTADLSKVKTGVDGDGHFYRGDINAAIKLVEFSEFQCPYCARHYQQTEPLIDANFVATGKAVHIFRNFPLDFHPNAMPAAQAAYCAGQQKPELFWAMHDWLFATQDKWSAAEDAAAQFRAQAVTLKVDAAKLDACLKAPETTAAIQSDLEEGQQMGVSGTPGFFINDWFLSGAQPYSEFQAAFDKAQRGVHPPPSPTPLPAGVETYDPDPNRPGFTFDGSPTLGSAKAPLVMFMFEDYKCGYCAQHSVETEPTLRKKYVETGQLRVVWKYFPIYAPKAASAASCAGEQGKFWEFSDLLFAKQKDWQEGDDEQMAAYAKSLGLDDAKFRQCLKANPYQSNIDNDMALGQQAGVRGTPYFLLLNELLQTGIRIPGAMPLADFENAIQQTLNPPLAVTPTPAK